MQYLEFENQLFFKIENDDGPSAIRLLEDNSKIVMEYLNNKEDTVHVKEFINRLNDSLLETKSTKDFEDILKHPLMTLVWQEFKESDILIRACDQAEDTTVTKWLLTQPLNLFVRNNEGVTALMKAASHYNLEFVVDYILSNTNDKYINLEDRNGNTALFYAIKIIPILKKLLKRGMNYNHVNGDGDSLLMYSCKHEKFHTFDFLIKQPDIDCSQINNDGKHIGMILVEKKYFKGIDKLSKTNCDINYKNKSGETMVSTLFHSYYAEINKYQEFPSANDCHKQCKMIKSHAIMLIKLNNLGCDFNVSIDGDGNTPIMASLIMKDYVTCYYLLRNNINIDLSLCNKYGINATYLSLFINSKDILQIQYALSEVFVFKYQEFKKLFVIKRTYDFTYPDPPLIHELYKNDFLIPTILMFAPNTILQLVNSKQENGIIVATKLGKTKILECLLQSTYCKSPLIYDINHQDDLGNTALHYAVTLKDAEALNLLIKFRADPTVENKEGKSPLALAKAMDDSYLMELLQTPPPSSEKTKSKKLFSRFKKESSTPVRRTESSDYYFKQNQIKIYEKEYEYMDYYEPISIYRPSAFIVNIQKWMGEVYFYNYV